MKASAAVLALLLSAVNLHADELVLRNGSSFTGTVVENGSQVSIQMEFGTMSFQKIDVRSITRSKSPMTEYQERAERAKSVEEFLELAAWARGRDLPGKAKEAYARVLSLAPGHPEAMNALGIRPEPPPQAAPASPSGPLPTIQQSLDIRTVEQMEQDQKNRLELERTRLSLERQRLDDERKLREEQLKLQAELGRRQQEIDATRARSDQYDAWRAWYTQWSGTDPLTGEKVTPAPTTAPAPVTTTTSSGGAKSARR